ncbi:PKD domain-containing protein [Arthrobacter humicola]|uniref:PKD domain-containing protein n=1 Tax=Arthrobacter humicola TaxID=409291 RepID=UPI001FABEAB3|nr:PKD domain-containing protein [Arthrobacter humicola]
MSVTSAALVFAGSVAWSPAMAQLLPGRTEAAEAAVVPAVPGELRVTAAGDYSTSAAAAGVLSRVGQLKPDLHLALGDLSYGATGAEQSWCDFVTARTGAGFPVELVSGNHESNGQNGNINDFSACLPNQLPGAVGTYGRQYYVDVPQQNPLARFVFITPGIPFTGGTPDYSVGSPRYNWTAAAIDGARSASIPWVVVAMHTPCISIGIYDCVAGTDITNLLLSKKVDVVLNGHEHHYQRSKQLSVAAGCAGLQPGVYNPSCVRDGDNSLAKGAGSVFTTVGTGGVGLRDVNTADPEAPYFAAYSGLNLNPSHGLLDMKFTATTLDARFVATDGAFTDAFSVASSGSNVPPTASFSSSCSNLTCAFDASASTDPDGTIASYAWDFGDGTSGTGPSPSHPYATPSSYNVTLTVTDNGGATGAATQTVTTTAGTAPFAQDAFNRAVTNGLGTAETGGPWSVTGSTSDYSVASGTGRLRIASAGVANYAYLGSVSSSATDLYLELATDKPASGSGLYFSAVGRRIAGSGEYRAKAQVTSTGAVNLSLIRTSASGTETTIQSGLTIGGLNYAVGDRLAMRLQVTGTGTTTIRAKVWKVGTAEPVSWQRSVTDTTAALQAAGGIGLFTYLSSSANNAPITVLLDNVTAAAP